MSIIKITAIIFQKYAEDSQNTIKKEQLKTTKYNQFFLFLKYTGHPDLQLNEYTNQEIITYQNLCNLIKVVDRDKFIASKAVITTKKKRFIKIKRIPHQKE